MSDYRCYICGAEPQLVDVTQLGDPEPRYMPGAWPLGDHPHAVAPPADHTYAVALPTPSELQAGGDDALAAIVESWQR